MSVSRWAFARVGVVETRLMEFAVPLTPTPDPLTPFCPIQQKDKGLKDPEFPQVSQGAKGRGRTL